MEHIYILHLKDYFLIDWKKLMVWSFAKIIVIRDIII